MSFASVGNATSHRLGRRRILLWFPALVGLAAASVSARAIEVGGPTRGGAYQLDQGETHEGDLYVAGRAIHIAGVQKGDLLAFAQSVSVPGAVEGDLFAFAQSVNVTGRIADSARIFAQTFVLSGEVDGDLLIFAETVSIGPEARVTGDVFACASQVATDGTIEGDLKVAGGSLTAGGRVAGKVSATCGEIALKGQVAGADLKCDTLHVDPGARIAGDLVYSARHPAQLEPGVVGGEVIYRERKPEPGEAKQRRRGVFRTVAWWVWSFLAAMVVGSLWIALFPGSVPRLERAMDEEMLPSFGVGFVVLLVVPVAAILMIPLIVTIPLSLLVLALYVMALYLAKIPVAVWLGRRLLRAAGRPDPSPYWGLLGGLAVLYLAFSLPYLGFWFTLAAILLGLGATLLAARRVRPGPEAADAAPVAPA